MSKLCSLEGCDNPIFSKGFCKYHYPKKSIRKISNKQKIIDEQNKGLLEEDHRFYEKVWECKEHHCYECGVGISELLTVNCHHILPKAKFKELRHNVNNIVILCQGCHSKTETNIDFVPKVKELTRLKLLEYENDRDYR